MSKRTLYHGSSQIIKEPLYGEGKLYNDYGRGFYCTEHIELAKEWACTEGVDGYVNQYEIETKSLRILNLSGEEYMILHWLALLVHNRKIRISTPLMKRGVEWLETHYLPRTDGCDVIVGYRADDSYFSFARAFINNEISLEQLSYAMKLGKLGEQFVLVSARAFESIKFLGYEAVNHKEYYVKRKARDDKARMEFRKELENDHWNGIYIRDMIREEVALDGSWLR